MMYIGENEIPGIYLGSEEIPGIYVGEELIYPMTVTAWSVSPSAITIASSGGTEKIKIAALSSWTISSSESWITFSQNSGDSGRTTLIATIASNDSTARTATITITDNDSYTSTISVSQEGLAFSVSPDALAAGPNAQSLDLTIASPLAWTATSSESWATLSTGTGVNGITTITVSVTSTDSARTATITVTNGTDTSAITLNQVDNIYRFMPLTFEIISAGTLNWYAQSNNYTKSIEYKLNGGEWTQITSSKAGTKINVSAGDIVQFRGDNAQYAPQDGRCNCWSGTSSYYMVYGNIMSLIDSTGYTNLTTFTQPNVFMNFFNKSKCVDAENLYLPVTALTNACYQGLLAQNGDALQVGPLLPAETLVEACYAYFFYNSGKINNIRCLATDISARNCTQEWVRSAPSSGTFYKNPNMSSWGRGTAGVPNNWTIVDYNS